MPIISCSNKHYNTVFSTDLKAEKKTITTIYLVAANSGAPAPAGTTTACLVTMSSGARAFAANNTACLVATDKAASSVSFIDYLR